jgi:hypothetical protein
MYLTIVTRSRKNRMILYYKTSENIVGLEFWALFCFKLKLIMFFHS